MSATVDERVVEMRFDNRQFESNVQTSLSTLDKLKQGLNLTESAKGLTAVSSAAKQVSFDSLASGVEAVRVKFSALEVMAVTALQNITNSVINTGKQMLHSLTVEPIKDGFSEYELKMDSVQTIMASTGADLDVVMGKLNELNLYADKTIYSFSDMTNNIGKFTNAGVSLDDSVAAIQGVANVAAVSGANANEASRAMYNFAQALSSGCVKLIDWKSIENANMATVEFKTQLLDSAVAAGTLTKTADGMYKVLTKNSQGSTMDDAISATQNFNDSLAYQWMTTEVLTTTLGKYSDETTAIGKKAFAAAQDVKTFTQLMDTLKEAVGSGWAETWEIVFGNFGEAKELWTEVSNVFGGIIDAQAKARNSMLSGWKDLGGRKALIDAFRNAFEGLNSVISPVKEAFRDIFPPMTSKQLYKLTKTLRDFTAHLKLSDSQSEKLKSTFKGLFALLDIGVTAFKAAVGGVKDLVKSFTGFGDGILDVTSSWGDWLSGLRDAVKETDIFAKAVEKVTGVLSPAILKAGEFLSVAKEKFKMPGFEGFLETMQSVWGVISKIGGKVSEVCSVIGDALANAFRSGDIGSGLDILNGGLFAGVLLGIKSFIGGLDDAFDGVNGTLENITGILDSVRGCFEAYQQNLKAGTLLKIAGAIGILAASILVIATIEPEKLTTSLGAVTALFGELMGSLALFGRFGGNLKGTAKTCAAMVSISVSVGLLAGALKKLSTIDSEGITRGLSAIGGLMAELAVFLKTAKLDGKAMGTATGILILSGAMVVLASAVKKFSAMSWEEIGKGLASIGALLLEVSAFTKLTGNAKHVISTAAGMALLGVAMKTFAAAVADFGSMSWEEIGRGLTAMGGALAEVSAAMNLLPKNMAGLGLGLLAVGAAMKALADALGTMGNMSWEEIGRGLAAMGGALAELAVGLNVMKGTLSGSAAMVVAAGALAMLAPILKLLGSMSLAAIGKSLLALAGGFGIFAAAGYLLTPVIGTIVTFSAAISGVALALSALFTALALMDFASAIHNLTAPFEELLNTITIQFLKSLAKLLPDLIVGVVNAIKAIVLAIADTVVECAPAICQAVTAILTSVVGALTDTVPVLVDGIFLLLDKVLSTLVEYAPTLIQAPLTFLSPYWRALRIILAGLRRRRLMWWLGFLRVSHRNCRILFRRVSTC